MIGDNISVYWSMTVTGLLMDTAYWILMLHDDVIKWKHFPRNWRFVRGIHRFPVISPHKGQWSGALIFFSLICVWINGWVNNHEAADLRRCRAHYDVTVMDSGQSVDITVQRIFVIVKKKISRSLIDILRVSIIEGSWIPWNLSQLAVLKVLHIRTQWADAIYLWHSSRLQ